MKQTSKLFPLLFSIGLFYVSTSFYVIFVTYWLEEGFQEPSYFKISLIVGIPMFISIVGITMWGIISDHFQQRRVLVSIASMAAALQYLLLAKVVTNVMTFLLLVSFFSLLYSAMQAAAPTLTTLLLREKGQASGLYIMTASLGMFFGSFLGGILYPRMGMRWLLGFGFFLFVISGIIVLFSEDPKEYSKRLEKDNTAISWGQVMKIHPIAIVIVATFLVHTGNFSFVGLSTNYLINKAGLSTLQVGIGSAFATLSGAFLSQRLGGYMDRHGRRNIFLFGVLIYPLFYSALFIAWDPWVITAIWSLPYYAMTYTAGVAIMADVTQPSARAKAVGLFFASISLAQALGAMIGGFVADILGLQVIVLLPIPIGVGTSLFAYFLLKETLQKNDNL